ncbi:MAG: type II toxin-antitoxin system PemK/MazF family toxin [Bacteroidetes bacterium]|nr:type II toxin-antitoxin system PemK/MazF family toxin [Bacteroidota bacterium]
MKARIQKWGNSLALRIPRSIAIDAGFAEQTMVDITLEQGVGLAIMCPITSKPKAYPFEVHLPKNGKLQGAVLSDHVRSLDWVKRKATFIEALPARSLKEVLAKLHTLIGDQR